MTLRGLALAVRSLALAPLVVGGCPKATTGGPRDPPDDASGPARGDGAATEDGADADAGSACGTEGLRIEDLRWLPGTTRAVVMLDLDDPALPAALARLAARARGAGHGLPIDLALPLGEWTWQIPALSATLWRAGLQPGELLFVRTDEASGAFALSHDCDVDVLRERTAAAWGLSWRSLVHGALGRTAAGSDPPFPWDVLVLPGGRIMLVAAGRGDAWLRALAPDPARAGLGAKLGEALARVGAAPIRGVIAGAVLVDPDADTVASAQTLRATAEGVEVGDSLSAPP